MMFGTIIHELATLCGAVLHSGAPTAITNTSLADTRALAGYSDDDLIGKRVYIWDGPGIGQERLVTDSTGATSLVTVPTWDDNPVVETSRYDLLAPGWDVEALRVAWKTAQRQRRTYHMRPAVDESITVTEGTYEYTVPQGIDAITYIMRENTLNGYDFLTPIPSDMWSLSRDATRQIFFQHPTPLPLSLGFVTGTRLQLVGQRYEDEPDSDSDSILIPTGNIMMLACYYALSIARTRDPNANQGYAAMANIYYQRFLEGRGDEETLLDPAARLVYN